ncbi:LysR family transcriptional regulator ArgP [Paraferrimonas sp. SM1919]|uniref:LysR family transcriptional regulator ArgP n=1 Tax=Paraferrimonas sp. SM1919 TaxID=2662263 RepID=UPI0013D81D89|nr:LysR family transcriptional regulator ArgP [Paraferrimonas sp. SM1919]
MFDYKSIQSLEAIATQGGFDKAAKSLHISQSAISQRIKQLEDQIGQPLLIRSNPVEITATGKKLLRHFKQVRLLEHELQADIKGKTNPSSVNIALAVNADSLATWFMPALNDLVLRQDWLLQVTIDDEAQTHNLLKAGSVIGCITTQKRAMSGCSSDFLGIMRYFCVASPRFCDKYFQPAAIRSNLLKAPAVVFNAKDKLHHKFLKQYFDIDEQQFNSHQIPSSEGFLEMIKLGFGYGMVSHLQADKLIQRGQLVNLFPEHFIDVPLYWQHWNISAQQNRLLFRALSLSSQKLLIQPGQLAG